ncbi:MAG: ATP phosphoribosyltransferase [Alphaproteobacteria bacterium MarineAlpha5_Bin11]|nr:ATP phosphoribosyltransferase [Pelagibacteraceae bacterium]PPR44368.1 MAG: ATP phosphoribosyltransferase [Alphaproteobacteria bacterium MarineAlpha5_Bin11]PPR51487.1 MAG: ATP phosphoribosyltransferase [Alphaproteobacteria bacterium MarineAlpha5_Bin10]|tara:strand:+ start:10018 stop:10677 length:660 start_codon:yes stop_codon:yes gene_type:complete
MSKKNTIRIAVPRGRILSELRLILKEINLLPDESLYDDNCRKLSFESNNSNIEFIKVRAFDVCTFVAFGAAQIGVAGSDIIEEFDYSEVYSPISLGIGRCRLSVAALKSLLKNEDPQMWSNIRVATKYPKITKEFFADKGVQVEAIKLNGSVELATKLLMCRRIVDLVSSGKTLKENGLVEVEKILDVESKLIVNRSAYKTDYSNIAKIISKFKKKKKD